MAELVGIDVGGTFTDFVFVDGQRLIVRKEPTSPQDQSEAIGHGLRALGVGPLATIIHGTTTATNALLERRGARTALLTTEGFADALAIGRQNRPHLYRLSQTRRSALVPHGRRLTVRERLAADGTILTPLETAQLRDIANALKECGAESLAVVFLFSFLNETHEREAAQVLQSLLPSLRISLSVDILPEYREYERTATTVINAYVQPLVGHYLERLIKEVGGRPVWVMQSNGGTIDVPRAASQPARLVLSGPAGGVVGAFKVARVALNTDAPHVITFDMGGTSTDVALCPGTIPRTAESVVGDLPLRLPSTGIHTVGAGGGSIARVDAGGALRVGPESAGAVPGPVCYGKGGTQVTVTDANLVLGRLDAGRFTADGTLAAQSAHRALALLGTRLGRGPETAALGVIRVANATMERALRRVSVEQGYDPRGYALVPFGGAGPLHACELAEALGIRKIVVPRYPGVLSAMGLLMADITFDASRALLRPLSVLTRDPAPLVTCIGTLCRQVTAALAGTPHVTATLDLRYHGQSYELELPLGLPASVRHLEACEAAFHEAHLQRYGYNAPHRPVECVNVRVQASLPRAQPPVADAPEAAAEANTALTGSRRVWLRSIGPDEIPCYDRQLLGAGHHFPGPALIFQYDSTILVTADWHVHIDRRLNAILQHESWSDGPR